MISGNVDLSVGGNLGLSACVFAILVQAGVPFYVTLIVVAVLGLVLGAINGFMVTKLRITPVIATLATMSLFQGIGKLLVPDGTDIIKGGMPDNMNAFARGKLLFDLPIAVYIMVAIVIVIVIFQRRTIVGKYTVAIGGNETAARLSGINVGKMVWILYILVGCVAALGGVTRASYMQAGDPDSGIGIEVDAIIAILLGGTSFYGGKGSVLKTVVAVFILISLEKGMNMVGMDPWWAMLVKGMVFFVALILDNLLERKSVK
jgi:ribose transport system permease protein